MNLGIQFDEFDSVFSLPDGPPEISYPFKGDSVPDGYPWFIFQPSTGTFVTLPSGSGFNQQVAEPNALAFIVEQDFMVRMANYTPLPLNTPYQDAWGLGWNGPVDLATAILVTEGRLEVQPGGLARLRRTFACVPASRNSYESFTFKFPGFQTAAMAAANPPVTRQPVSLTVNTRLQYDYYLLTPGGSLPYLNPVFSPYQAAANAVLLSLFLPDDALLQDVVGTALATIPPATDYANAITTGAEIVVEASKLNPWMGNIYERVTRFTLAQ